MSVAHLSKIVPSDFSRSAELIQVVSQPLHNHVVVCGIPN